jgi:serine/threonine-protein kinase
MTETKAGRCTEQVDSLDSQLARLLREQVDDWTKGAPRPLRAYLDERPGLPDRAEAIVELVNQELLLRIARGETPEPAQYLAEFPDLIEPLQRLFEVHALPSADGGSSRATMIITPEVEGAGSLRSDAALPSIPGYDIKGPIGRGGVGIVYLARHHGLQRDVALKFLHEARQKDSNEIARFRREAAAAARCQHPNLVQIHDIGEHAGHLCLALEYVAGGHLGRSLAGRPQPPRPAAELVETLARAMDHAHTQGVVHRDLKPANVLLTADGHPKITDFGLAKLNDASAHTELGVMVGTLAYMAPEQVRSRPDEIGPRTDIHALGLILYEALTGQPPYRGETPEQILHAILNDEPKSPSGHQPGVPRDLEAICLKCLEKEPSRRYRTAAELAEDLRRFLHGEPVAARRVGPAGRLWRWCRRNPRVASLAASLAAVLLLGGSAFVVQTYRHNLQLQAEVKRTQEKATEASRNAAQAERNAVDARRHYQDARLALQAMLARVNDKRLTGVPKLLDLRRGLQEDARDFYDRVLSQIDSKDPEVRVDTARALAEAAALQFKLGQPDLAIETIRRAVQMAEGLLSEQADKVEYMELETDCLQKLGATLYLTQRWDETIAASREALKMANQVAEARRDDPSKQELLAMCHTTLGNAVLATRNRSDALTHYEAATRIRKAIDPLKLPGVTLRIAESLVNEAVVMWNREEFEKAADILHGAERILLDIPPEQRNDGGNWVGSLCHVYTNWGGVLMHMNHIDEAIDLLGAGIRQIERYMQDEPNDAGSRHVCLTLHGNRAIALGGKGDHIESAREWARVLELSPQPVPHGYRIRWAIELFKSRETERAAAEVSRVKTDEVKSGEDCYVFAIYCALRAAAARKEGIRSGDTQQKLEASSIAHALRWLQAAAAGGFFDDPTNRGHAKTEPDLDILRGNPEFQRLFDARSDKP